MFSLHKNSYLQGRFSYVNPRIINRSIDLAREQPCINSHDLLPPFNRLTSEQPSITPIAGIDVTRRPLGFGRVAMPKLRRELHHKDSLVALQAIRSICDLVHDPERGYEAVNLRIPDRLADLLLHDWVTIREETAMALTIIAELFDGKQAIVNNQTMMNNLEAGLLDAEMCVRLKIASCLEMVARTWITADFLVDYGFIPTLLNNLVEEPEEITEIHLETLKSIMYYNDGKNQALDQNAFGTFVSLLERENSTIVSRSLDCLMILTSISRGKKLAMETNLLSDLNRLLHYADIEICTSAASVLMFCTEKTKAKIIASTIPNLAKRLVKLTTNPLNSNLQLYCVKTLTNMIEHPTVRKEVKENHGAEMEKMQIQFDPSYKETLLKILNWVPQNAT